MDRHFSIMSMWLQLELCALAVLLTKGEIRCYCDAPHCVATGYMCKSEVNACFTRSLDASSPRSLLSHGCYDPLLNSDDVCRSDVSFDATGRGSSTLECCHEDMCNYRGLQELAYGRRETLERRDRHRQSEGGGRHLVARVQEAPSSREVWFRAAVIAVPIAGGLILVLLIALALRMLRSESRRLRQQRHEMLSRLHYSFHGHQLKKGHVAKLDLECMVPVTGHENCCLTCDKMRQSSELAGERLLSLVHLGKYAGRGKMEFV